MPVNDAAPLLAIASGPQLIEGRYSAATNQVRVTGATLLWRDPSTLALALLLFGRGVSAVMRWTSGDVSSPAASAGAASSSGGGGSKAPVIVPLVTEVTFGARLKRRAGSAAAVAAASHGAAVAVAVGPGDIQLAPGVGKLLVLPNTRITADDLLEVNRLRNAISGRMGVLHCPATGGAAAGAAGAGGAAPAAAAAAAAAAALPAPATVRSRILSLLRLSSTISPAAAMAMRWRELQVPAGSSTGSAGASTEGSSSWYTAVQDIFPAGFSPAAGGAGAAPPPYAAASPVLPPHTSRNAQLLPMYCGAVSGIADWGVGGAGSALAALLPQLVAPSGLPLPSDARGISTGTGRR